MWGFFIPPANEVWGKVIFLHLSVILFTGGVSGPGGVPGLRGVSGPRGVPVPRGVPGPGGPGPGGGGAWSWDGRIFSRPTTKGEVEGIWSRHTLKGEVEGNWPGPPPTATAAGGTHPTGMHSC